MRPLRILLDGEEAARDRSAMGAQLRTALDAATADPARMLPLWRAFSMGEPVREPDLVRAAGDALVDLAVRTELLVPVDSGDGETWLRGSLSIVAVALLGELRWIASDFPWYDDDPLAVSGPGAASSTLLALVPPEARRERVVDIGSGSGALGVALATEGTTLLATDVNPRAAALTELTAALAGVPVTVATGDLTGPVDGLHDLVVCNPPFVLGRPAGRTVFRDAETPDAHAGLAHDIAALLDEDGIGVYLTNWVYGGELPDPLDALRSELTDVLGSDVLVLERALVPVAEYVAVWTEDDGLAATWTKSLQDAGVDHVGTGAVVLRRLSEDDDDEPTRVSVVRAYGQPQSELAGLVGGWLSAQTAARHLSDSTVLQSGPYELDTQDGTIVIRAISGFGLTVSGPADQVRGQAAELLEATRSPRALGEALRAVPSLRSAPSAGRELARMLLRAQLVNPA